MILSLLMLWTSLHFEPKYRRARTSRTLATNTAKFLGNKWFYKHSMHALSIAQLMLKRRNAQWLNWFEQNVCLHRHDVAPPLAILLCLNQCLKNNLQLIHFHPQNTPPNLNLHVGKNTWDLRLTKQKLKTNIRVTKIHIRRSLVRPCPSLGWVLCLWCLLWVES